MRKLLSVLALALSMMLVACGSMPTVGSFGGGDSGNGGSGGGGQASRADFDSTPLRIVAATELEDLQPAIDQASRDLGFPVELSFPAGTLDNSRTLLEGGFDGAHDATWFATNRYVEVFGAASALVDSASTGRSPVALGIHADKARELGWDRTQPTWADIADAVSAGDLTFGMTDPASSNSGFSALVSVATALADTGQALDTGDIARVSPQLRELFAGQTMTSGSSAWLTDTFLDDPSRADAIFSYESVLHSIVREGLGDITVIVPADGVVTAEYPLSTLKNPSQDQAREKVAALVDWFEEHPEAMTDTFRRPVDPSADVPTELSSQLLIELPFPATRAITDELVAAFHNELRAPGDTVFVLDTSGSMEGERLTLLQETLHSLIDGSAEGALGGVGLRDREQVTLLPFADEPGTPTTVRFEASTARQLSATVDTLRADGATALYSALVEAYGEVADAGDGSIPSIVLMSDGEVTAGIDAQRFRMFHATLPPQKKSIPVFVILYGEANVGEMTEIAQMTGGKVFDALEGDLGAAFREIRGYQ